MPMKRILHKIHLYFLLKSNSITMKQANIFTTFLIFLFTILFAYLLIVENYHDYERALYGDSNLLTQESAALDEHTSREKKLKSLLIKNTIAIATLSFILFAIMLGFTKIFNTLIQRDIRAFLDFFRDTAHNEQVLNPNVIFFKDFKTMVGYANSMIDTISEQKRTLKELNVHLEDKVKEKTADLQLTNEHLLEEKKFSEDILAAQKKFLRHTVHETNTPLSVILTSIELYNMKNKKDRQLSKIEAAAKNIFNIYDDLSYLVKKEQVTYPKVAIELNEYLRSRIDFFAEVAELSKLTMKFLPYKSESYIYFNETKLQRIVDNTLTNAIKYTLAGEEIEIKIEVSNIEVDFAVSSHSKEIKDKEKIFDSFYREEKGEEGFGIGLGLVKNICDEEGVRILLDSSDTKTTFAYRFKMMGE